MALQDLWEAPIMINLDRHPQRFEHTQRLLENVGFRNLQRFSAIDGFATSDNEFQRDGIASGTPGQKGCTLSHLNVWRQVATGSREYQFVFEDDVLPHRNLATLLPLYWEKTPRDVDLILVGNQMHPDDLSTVDADDMILNFPSFCLHAYIIKKIGARRLLELFYASESYPAIDIFLIEKMKHHEFTNYVCYNGAKYRHDALDPCDHMNIIWESRDTGIVYQNYALGSSIHAPHIMYGAGA